MASRNGHGIGTKIDDLTESLHRTTDVLSTADRMIDHYRDLNREQEHEIARLQNDLHKLSKNEKSQYETGLLKSLTESINGLKKTRRHEGLSSDSSSDEHHRKKSKSHHQRQRSSSRVRFQEDFSPVDSERDRLETSIAGINRRQDFLEHELQRDRLMRNSDIERLDASVKKQFVMSHEENKMAETNGRLKQIQDQIEEDHSEWKRQQKEVKYIADEMKTLKDVVLEATTPRPKGKLSRIKYSHGFDPDLEDEMNTYKRKIKSDEGTIAALKEQVNAKEKEKIVAESTVNEIESLGKMKSNQLKLLEEQLENEKTEKQRVLRELEKIKMQVSKSDKEQAELLLHLSDAKSEARTNQLAYDRSLQSIPELKRLLEKSERSREKYSDHIVQLRNELELKENLVTKLSNEISEYASKVKLIESEMQRFSNLAEERLSNTSTSKHEIENLKTALLEAQHNVKQSEKARSELKQKALQAIKDYKTKCRQYEKKVQNLMETKKENELELSKEASHAKQLEISKLLLQKDYQESMHSMDQLKTDLSECESTLSQVTIERSQLQEALSHANDETKQISKLQREIQDLQNEKKLLNNQLLDEKRKHKEFEVLVHENYEKSLSNKEESTSLYRQLQQEKSNHNQEIAQVREECEYASKHEISVLRQKNRTLEEERAAAENKLVLSEARKMDLETMIKELEKGSARYSRKEVEQLEQIKSLSDENNDLKRQNLLLKSESKKRIKDAYDELRIKNERNDILEQRVKEFYEKNSKTKDYTKAVLSIITRDIDNILNLFTEEDENILPVKDIPDTIAMEHRELLLELREKLETSYSIGKTLKRRFQQQKILIKKAQEKIVSQTKKLDEMEENHSKERDSYLEKRESSKNALEKNRQQLAGKEKNISLLKVRVTELTNRLEECARALHKSLEVDKERKNVLQEIEHLKSEHVENQKRDENYYRCAEKIDVLTEQLSEAKNSLSQVKQDGLDASTFANRMIQTFGSVSPSRKRRMFSFESPKESTAVKSLFGKGSYTEDSALELAKTIKPNDDQIGKKRDPMSMTDEEFNNMFLSTDATITSGSKNRSRSTSPDKKERSERKRTKKKVTNDD